MKEYGYLWTLPGPLSTGGSGLRGSQWRSKEKCNLAINFINKAYAASRLLDKTQKEASACPSLARARMFATGTGVNLLYTEYSIYFKFGTRDSSRISMK
jgi:hypothetical protein